MGISEPAVVEVSWDRVCGQSAEVLIRNRERVLSRESNDADTSPDGGGDRGDGGLFRLHGFPIYHARICSC